MKNNEDVYDLGTVTDFTKSNFLISAKYKTSLMEAKILALALSRVKSDNGTVYAEMQVSELKKIFGVNNSHSFYEKLSKTASLMTGRTIGMTDPSREKFDYLSIITRATCKNGLFLIKFNTDLKDYVMNLKNNFTIMSLPVLLSFENVYAFRLYEILLSNIYKTNIITIGLSELKFLLGAANAEADSVKKVLSNESKPDYDKAYEKASTEKMFEVYSNFRVKVLDKAINDINDKTEFIVKYKPNRGGKGGKIQSITFFIEKKQHEIVEEVDELEELNNTKDNLLLKENNTKDKEQIIEIIADDIIEEKIKLRDIKTIAETANYDIEKIRNAYSIMKKQKEVKNVVGFLLSAIKNDYKDIPNKSNNNAFGFEQQTYDFDSIEKNFLAN